MKKVIHLYIILCLVLSLCGCGKQSVQETPTENIPETTINETVEEAVSDSETDTEAVTKEPTTEETTEETTESTPEVETTQLFKDFFEPYADFAGSVTPQTFKEANADKLSAYDVEITEGNEEDMWKFIITDSNGDHMSIWFYPENVSDPPTEWIETITLITYSRGDKEISVSDDSHIKSKPKYNTFDKNRETKNAEVNSVEELIAFMFVS